MDDLFSRTVRLAHEKPALRHHLLPLLKEAQESDKDSKFEEGEDVSVSELPEELQKNVQDPPPSVEKLKDELKKKASLRAKVIRLAHDNPKLRPLLLPILAKESDKDSKFEEGEDVSVSELPEELQKNVQDPPPSVEKLKSELKKKAEDGGEDDGASGGSGGASGKVIEFMKEMGDKMVTHPETKNKVKLKSVKAPKGKKGLHPMVKREFDKWIKSQKDSKPKAAPGKKEDKKPAPEQKSRKQRWREFMQKDEAARKERKKNVKRKASLLFRAMTAACSSDALGEKLFPVIKANATKPLVKGKAASAGMKASVREQGLVASFMDLTVKDNPYPKGSELRRLWAEGLFEGV